MGCCGAVNSVPVTLVLPESLRAAKIPSRPSAVWTMFSTALELNIHTTRVVSGTKNLAVPRPR
ncbi:hypothetical protein GCM10009565_01870 [Amycolatopsis albidoflavus]